MANQSSLGAVTQIRKGVTTPREPAIAPWSNPFVPRSFSISLLFFSLYFFFFLSFFFLFSIANGDRSLNVDCLSLSLSLYLSLFLALCAFMRAASGNRAAVLAKPCTNLDR